MMEGKDFARSIVAYGFLERSQIDLEGGNGSPVVECPSYLVETSRGLVLVREFELIGFVSPVSDGRVASESQV